MEGELMDLLETRRSIRKFDEGRPVPPEVVDEVLAAARVASSAANLQPLRYLVVRSPELVEQVFPLLRWAARLPPEQGVPRAGERPTLYVATLIDRSVKSPYAETDAGLALSNMTLTAWNEGVASCILGSVDREGLKALLDIDEGLDVHSVTAFGYPLISSRVVEPQGGDLGYRVDGAGDYLVPKRPVDEVARIL